MVCHEAITVASDYELIRMPESAVTGGTDPQIPITVVKKQPLADARGSVA
jgi:hypothetical protein